jgi:sugar phosphate isomerase/epimerase
MTSFSRRSFLVRAGAAGIAMGAASSRLRGAQAAAVHRPVGIQLYAVKSALEDDAPGTLATLKAIGYAEVETAGFGKRTAKEFRRLLDDHGLVCPSAHLSFDPANLGPAFDDAQALGAEYATSGALRASLRPPLETKDPGMTLEEARRTAELANVIGEQARRAGLQYAYHNHNAEFVDQGGTVGYDLLLHGTDPALVKFEIDCGWMVLGGRDPIDYFRKYPGRFPMIHVKDFLPLRNAAPNDGRTDHPGAELGHGMIDYKPIFAAAEKAGLQHFFAEQEGPFVRMSQLDAARQAYVYLRSMS